MCHRQRGFSLVELIAVIIIIGVISVMVYPRFATSDTAAVQTGRDSLVAALFFAQQTAMARSTDDAVVAVVDSNSVTVNVNGLPANTPGLENPINFPSGVSVSPPGPTTFTYDKLGRIVSPSVPTTLTLTRGGVSAVVTVEASGYVHY